MEEEDFAFERLGFLDFLVPAVAATLRKRCCFDGGVDFDLEELGDFLELEVLGDFELGGLRDFELDFPEEGRIFDVDRVTLSVKGNEHNI